MTTAAAVTKEVRPQLCNSRMASAAWRSTSAASTGSKGVILSTTTAFENPIHDEQQDADGAPLDLAEPVQEKPSVKEEQPESQGDGAFQNMENKRAELLNTEPVQGDALAQILAAVGGLTQSVLDNRMLRLIAGPLPSRSSEVQP